ncbi:MAG: amidohydrolase [Eubacteriales bacterium]|nr:amidohydrolase [Eubacteriales bacterium]
MKKVLYNGKVYVDRDVFEEAVLVEDGRIAAVGKNDEILSMAEGADQIDCEGRTVIPGFNDSHMHLVYVGEAMLNVDLSGCKSVEEMVEKCIAFRKENPEFTKNGLFSQSWNQDHFDPDKRRLPNRHDLDKIATDIPVVLARICGHSSTANSKALEMMGLTKENNKIEGGDVILEEDGSPSGYLCENAAFAAHMIVPPLTIEQRKLALLKAMEYAVSHGITSVQSNDVGTIIPDRKEAYEMVKSLYEEGKALLRYHSQVGCPTMEDLKAYIESPEFLEESYDGWFSVGPLKMFKDGSLGARTATVRHEYLDDPGNYGVETTDDKKQQEMVDYAAAHGLQVVTHVIGDDAIEKTTAAYAKTYEGDKNNLRHCLIHCQITDLPLLKYIKKSGVLIAYQPIFLQTDLHAIESRCGKELSSTFLAMKTARDLDIRASYGSDSPVEDCNPFPCVYCAVNRKDQTGFPEGGFYPKECVDVPAAIDAYTVESAYMEFKEDVKGRIKPGYYADMVVLDQDIFSVDPMKIKDILPVLTMVGGKVVYQSAE